MTNQDNGSGSLKRAEFWLVIALLGALVLVLLLIFLFARNNEQKDLIGIILGAFGAWIGAGAAYFFGRENLREATSSILQMRQSPQERLARSTLRDLKPRPLPTTFKLSEATIDHVVSWLEKDPERFFATMTDDSGRVKNVVSEEAIYRYMKSTGKNYGEVKDDNISKVIQYVEKEKDKHKDDPKAFKALNNLIDAAVRLEQERSCSLAEQMMEQERKFVTIVLDANDTPIGYITTADIRRFVLSSRWGP